MSGEKRRVGRPTKYNKDLQEKADSYIYKLDELGHVVPSRVGLCCYLGIAKQTSFEWEKLHPDFSATLAAVEALQEHLVLNGGMSGDFNSTIAKLVLANHGYSDKQVVDNTSSDGTFAPSRIEIVAPKEK